MTDRNVQFPSRYKLVPVAGTSDIYDLEPVPGEITDPGTPVNKQTTLQDATAKALGLTQPDPTIDDAFRKLSGCTYIQTGSYKGTGTSGVSNPTSLVFDFVPKYLIIHITNTIPSLGKDLYIAGEDVWFFNFSLLNTTDDFNTYGRGSIKFTSLSKTVSWYTTKAESGWTTPDGTQLNGKSNGNGYTYEYIAFG